MIDDLALAAVQVARQETHQGFATHRIAGLDGTLHQRVGRASHRVVLRGVLVPPASTDDLAALQEKAAAGAEVTFTADITTALSVAKMVIESFAAEALPGPPGQYRYEVVLAESPPLPPPAELSSFGGLDDLGLGDVGFDDISGVLDDIAEQASAVTEAADAALQAVEAAQALASLAGGLDLDSLTNPLKPLTDRVASLAALAEPAARLPALLQDLSG